MKILIFAGGAGTRLWPLSRKNTPKQFHKLFDGKSTLQLAVERVEEEFGPENIVISTNEAYVSLVKEQLPQIPYSNIVGEPTKRDLTAAIGYNFMRLQKMGYKGPVAILWSDHLMERVDEFLQVLNAGESLVTKDPGKIVFVAEKPRYAECNLGWIHVGKRIEDGKFEFLEWVYKPELSKCKQLFASGEWYWNPGYFVVDLDFLLALYKKHVPEMFEQLKTIRADIGTHKEAATLKAVYPQLEAIHFDNAIAEKIPAHKAIVLVTNMGWSDPGTLYAFKEALVKKADTNLVKGLVYELDSKDCVLLNEDKEKLITAIGLEGVIIVNTKDALLVVHKDNSSRVKDLVKKLEEDAKLRSYI